MAENDPATAAPLQVDDDVDSAIGDESDASDTTSLRSSIFNYHYENGRRYHAYHAGSYWGPNDEQAIEHLNIGHHVYNLLLGGRLYLAPISEQPQRVLDVGTGTGAWATDFADQHPTAVVIGTDLSPIQPTWVPQNLSFEISDCCEEWSYQKDSFDFIHIRGLYGSVANWSAFYAEVYKHVKPGGWVEQVEQGVVPKSFDGSTDGTIFEEWGKVSLEAGDAFGKTLRIVDESAHYMKEAGFEEVTEERFAMPVGRWPKDRRLKEIGLFNRLQWEEGIEGWTMMLLTQVLKAIKQQVIDLSSNPEHLKMLPHSTTIWNELLRPELHPNGRVPDPGSLFEESQALLFGGADTIGMTLMHGTFHILKDVEVYQKLKAELQQAWPVLEDAPSQATLETMPYLSAVVRESLRMSPGVASPLPRVVPASGTELNKGFIPGGTVVEMSSHFIHRNGDIFESPNDFKPERWLGQAGRDLEKWLVTFSRGPRSCLGSNLAWAELYLTFAHVYRKFDIEIDPSSPKELVWRDCFLPEYLGPHLKAKMRPVKE
ncbi:hypothetical protein EPUS_03572 [Endocarpon pusillum Z07020]|uniref:Uncharacterized protein n=1 Tax=Endocarpon pusillum (strain Z07020 / HMAS-L-300199) TaxID=1263415 RepID=U1HII6_ENDPU|nr:uncharacterized protein EPUS_03572 [Endocarpon pusillum Z07020]ERF70020.1 hypothetical protein EPUS_03572 [Endocarpon pusillum Z07020]